MPIVLCEPHLKLNQRHEDHLDEFYASNKAKHDLRRFRGWHQALHIAQNRALQFAIQIGASHILWTEDDQWGYPIDGLDVLLEADLDVIGFQTYFKQYPYHSMAGRLKFPGGNLLQPASPRNQLDFVERGGGDEIQEVDLLTWAFTLTKMRVFYRMEEAGLDPFRQWGPHPTDSFFCQYAHDLGIKTHVHFGFVIGHGEVEPWERVYRRRYDESIALVKRNIGMPAQMPMKDDFGHSFGLTDVIPENGKAYLEEPTKIVLYDEKGGVVS